MQHCLRLKGLNRDEIDGTSRICLHVYGSWSYQFPRSVPKFQNFHKSSLYSHLKVFPLLSPPPPAVSSTSLCLCFHKYSSEASQKENAVNWERDARMGVSGLYFLIATWLEQPITLIGRVDILRHSGHSSTNHCKHMRPVWGRANKDIYSMCTLFKPWEEAQI
jgi:hypothetical protein